VLFGLVIAVRRGCEAASAVNPADIRRLETRISRAARIGFVGSWLIPGLGIPLPSRLHGPHNAVESARTSTLHTLRGITIIVFCCVSCCLILCYVDVLHRSPQKADKFTRDCDDSDLRTFSVGQMIEALV
jgi:hypothetical protein